MIPATRKQRLLCLFVFGMLAFGFTTLATGQAQSWAQALLDEFDTLPLGLLIFVLISSYVAAIVVGLPNIIFSVGSGILMARRIDAAEGVTFTFTSAFLLSCTISSFSLCGGGIIAYFLAQNIFSSYAIRVSQNSKVFRALHRILTNNLSDTNSSACLGFADKGVCLVALMRTSLPHLICNYGIAILGSSQDEPSGKGSTKVLPTNRGVNEIHKIPVEGDSVADASDINVEESQVQRSFPLWKFCLTFVGHLPWVIVYSWLGCTLDSLVDLVNPSDDEGDRTQSSSRGVAGIIAAVITCILLTCVTQRELRKVLREPEQQKETTSDIYQ